MQQLREFRFDVASAISRGQRPYQEDALVADFPLGADLGFVVLADGMGGHAAGDVASKIVVTEVFSELKLQSGDPDEFAANLPEILRNAAMAANDCVKVHVEEHNETAGMGATLVAPVLVGRHLFWISIGDSPLFLFRNGELRQLNEDHSMAPQIDFMIRSGMMSEAVGRDHPDRNCLTSVLGGENIPRIDCPNEPFELNDGDILVVASDGLQFLEEDEIAAVLAGAGERPSSVIAQKFLSLLEETADPEQDNASFSVIRVRQEKAQARRRPARRRPANADYPMQGNGKDVPIAAAPSRLTSALFMKGASLFRSISE